MAVNLATKYADKVAERFAKSSVTAGAFNEEVKFNGVRGVTVYSVDTAPLGNYSRTGVSRYGTPAELGDSTQEFTMSQDKAFSYTIDKGNDNEQMNVKAAAKTLKREIDEVISPYLDKYRLNAWCRAAGQVVAVEAPSKANIVASLTDATASLDNRLVPDEGRTLFITADNYRFLKQNADFISVDKLGERALSKGVVGEVDGMKVVKCPAGWLPEGVEWLITHKSAVLAPTKLKDYKIHSDPPGINGNLVEGRLLHDAFVLGSRADGVYCGISSSYATAAPTVTAANSAYTLACATTGSTIYYTVDGTDPRYSPGRKTYTAPISYSGWAEGSMLKAYAEAPGKFPSAVTTKVYEG